MHCLEGISASTAAISAVTAVVIAAWFGAALSLASFWRRFARWRRRELQKPTRLLYWDLLPITRGYQPCRKNRTDLVRGADDSEACCFGGVAQTSVVHQHLVWLGYEGARKVNRVQRAQISRRQLGCGAQQRIAYLHECAGSEQPPRSLAHPRARVRKENRARDFDERDGTRRQLGRLPGDIPPERLRLRFPDDELDQRRRVGVDPPGLSGQRGLPRALRSPTSSL